MIGIFGGTFDPPHLGHLILADEALDRLQLERVLWMVTGHPPHKPHRPIASIEQRLEMVRRTIGDNPRFELSRLEADRPGPHYAADTLDLLTSEHPTERWGYIMGKDSLRDLPQWHAPKELVRLSSAIVVLNRPEVEVDLERLEQSIPGLEAKLRYLDIPLIEISSSDIRRRVREGHPFRFLVPAGVAEFIRQSGLYR